MKAKTTKYLREINSMFWPLVITFSISNILQVIDTMMLTSYDELAVAGVASLSQVMMTIGPVFFAVLSGIGIFASQYYGAKDYKSLKKTFGLSISSGLVFGVIGFLMISLFSESFIRFFTNDSSIVLNHGIEYAKMYRYVFLLYPINFAFTFSYRSIKLTKYPMYITTPMVLINTLLNWIFIYGKFGFAAMGAYGAALATFISYLVALVINIVMIYKLDLPFKGKISEVFDFDYKFVKPIIIKTIPIIISEFLFGFARLLYTKAFSTLGRNVFVGERIAENLTMFVNGFVFASANTVGAIIGTALGAMKDKADEYEVREKSIFLFKCLLGVSTSVLLVCWFILPNLVFLYNTETKEVFDNAVTLIKLNGVFAALRTISSSILFILRAGGDMLYATIVDSGLAWIIGLPLTYLALYFLDVSTLELKLITLVETVVKVMVALYRYLSWKWIRKVI